MLVCPQCQFENPTANKFCQECGTSLTEKACPSCGTIVPLSAQQCQNCGTFTGTVWWAVISGAIDLPLFPYIDAQQRYQLLEASSDDLPIEAKVLDLQPLQVSPLAALIHSTLGSSTQTEPRETDTSPDWDADALELVQIPVQVQLYLSLRSQIHQTIPSVHDAWKQGNQEILLLEDRSSLMPLVQYLKARPSVPMLQILHWFYEMAEIWDALKPLQCHQSLLELQNLRLDEDHTLCLQRLYESKSTLSLQDLGAIWQALLAQLSQTQSAALHLLLADLQNGQITLTDELRSRLETIARDFQASLTQTETMPDSHGCADLLTDEAEDWDATEVVTLPPDLEDEDTDDMPTIVLPMQLFSLDDAGRTDIGRQRDHNEDSFCINTQVTKHQLSSGKTVQARGLYVLCDGMGGHASGEVASQLAVDTLKSYFQAYWEGNSNAGLPPKTVIQEAVLLANKAIFDVNQQNARSGSGRMGTTLVMVLLYDTEIAVAHVGDSRLYRYTRKRGLEQITIDHEVGQREIQRGVEPEIAYGRPDAYQLTQALGPRDEYFVSPDIQFLELNEDALLVLASDGLTDNDLLKTHQQSHLDPLISSQSSLEQGASQLIELGNQYNGHDNITVIVIRAKVRPNLDQLR
ncbi:MAG: serine/threonine phosphatase [Leptolyngbyaceae cyanobacterium CSU_1_3]|nr:serine/threonine phosphatase [Leptolyngbyaceae cyanobacterium CSU_1_3]